MSTRIIHISDIHLGKTDLEKTNFERIIDKIIANYASQKPIIIVTGDIVDDGDAQQYDEARRILDKLYHEGLKVLLVPGNHDYGKNGNHAEKKNYQQFQSSFSKYFKNTPVGFPYELELNGHVFIGLNSMADVFKNGKVIPTNDDGIFSGNSNYGDKDVYFASGKLGKDQINKTIEILNKHRARTSEKKVILYLHHHPFPIKPHIIGKVDGLFHGLVDGEDFMNAIKNCHVDLLLFGHEHIHIDFSRPYWSGNYMISTILCSGKSTGGDRAKKGTIADKEKLETEEVPDKLLGRMIEITPDGKINPSDILF